MRRLTLRSHRSTITSRPLPVLAALLLALLLATASAIAQEWENIGPETGHVTWIDVCDSNPSMMLAQGAGAWLSLDWGQSWTDLAALNPVHDDFSGGYAIDHARPNRIAYMKIHGSRVVVFLSSDSGETWVQIATVNDDLRGEDMAFHPTDPDVIYVGDSRTLDGGETWESMAVSGEIITDPNHPDWVYTRRFTSLNLSTDRGETRTVLHDADVYNQLSVQPDGDGLVALNHNWAEAMYSPDQGQSFGDPIPLPDVSDRLVWGHEGKLFAANLHNIYMSDDLGENWDEILFTNAFIEQIGEAPDGYLYCTVTRGEVWRYSVPTDVEKPAAAPVADFEFHPAYPNPFNAQTRFTIVLPQARSLTLTIFDIMGRQVAQLADSEPRQAGVHRIPFDASALSSGSYFVRASTGHGQMRMQKITLVK